MNFIKLNEMFSLKCNPNILNYLSNMIHCSAVFDEVNLPTKRSGLCRICQRERMSEKKKIRQLLITNYCWWETHVRSSEKSGANREDSSQGRAS